MNPTRRSRVATAALTVLGLAALSSCHVNFGAQTDEIYQVAVGVTNREGTVDVLNALIVSGEVGTGTLVATLVNNDEENADRVVSIEGNRDDTTLTIETGGADLTVPAGGMLRLSEDNPMAVSGEALVPGEFVTLTFTFENAEPAELTMPVYPPEGAFATVPVPGGDGTILPETPTPDSNPTEPGETETDTSEG